MLYNNIGLKENQRRRRPDVIGFVNGIPLVFIELKGINVKLQAAYENNLSDYKDVIPKIFHCNAFVILSNGIESKIGSISSNMSIFMTGKEFQKMMKEW